jgi:hypothetical protein
VISHRPSKSELRNRLAKPKGQRSSTAGGAGGGCGRGGGGGRGGGVGRSVSHGRERLDGVKRRKISQCGHISFEQHASM